MPELTSIQAYAGTAAPFNFNGLVRHYYLRADPQMGDLSVNLKPKGERKRASHAIALDIRKRLAGLDLPAHTSIKVVEVPPGPPVLSTLLAEVYGPDAASRRATAAKLRNLFESVDFIVDVDDSFGVPSSGCVSRSISRRSSFTASPNRRSTTRSPRSSGEPRSATRSAAKASSRS